MPILLKTVLLLVVANVFMTIAWYAHLRNLGGKPLVIAILMSWGIAFAEYCFQVPANRIGYRALDLHSGSRRGPVFDRIGSSDVDLKCHSDIMLTKQRFKP